MFGLLLFSILAVPVCCSVNVVHIFSEDIVESFRDHPAGFGDSLPDTGIKGFLKYLKPVSKDSCHYYEPSPPWIDSSTVWIALMERQGCEFVNMVLAAQKLHYNAVIVHNNISMPNSNSVFEMTANGVSGNNSKNITIPSVFIGYKDGISLKKYDLRNDVRNSSRYLVQIKDGKVSTDSDSDSDESSPPAFVFWGNLVLTVPLVFVVVCCTCKVKYDQRRRTSTNTLRTPKCLKTNRKEAHESPIRMTKFTKDHRYETCPVCLDDFIEKDKIWILPCEHAYDVTRGPRPCSVSSTANLSFVLVVDIPAGLLILFIIIVYSVVIVRIVNQHKKVQDMATITTRNNNKSAVKLMQRNLLTLGAIICVTLVANVPRCVTAFCSLYTGPATNTLRWLKISNHFLLLNPVFDPVIHVLRIREFRERFMCISCKPNQIQSIELTQDTQM
ncbi:Hypothetical predicted protein [Mytilus galloprovincialis]|uniref:PA domain-containing protein n=1 Tax=Mytilus galloprovincialis TaxID=29158 RepID=A0A8B6C9X4_MYTGA|nr:Hypothetical predicted protein [Mytilus galloprovincialis]